MTCLLEIAPAPPEDSSSGTVDIATPHLSHLWKGWGGGGKALRKKGFCSLQEDSEDHMALTLSTRSLDFVANSMLSRSWLQSLKLVSSSMRGNSDLFIALVIFLHLRY